MVLPQRFEAAVAKLYDAFHNNRLNPECCLQCAVGNILDNTDQWRHFTEEHGSLKLNYVGLVHQRIGRRFNGYTPQELLEVEASFLAACGFSLPIKKASDQRPEHMHKDLLFQGLTAVVSYLCKLDQIPDVMDCSALFDYQLTTEEVLV